MTTQTTTAGGLKKCTCKVQSAWYNDFGVYKCQYCTGTLTDRDRVTKIVDYNTPTNKINRDKVIQEQVDYHFRFS